MFISILKLCKHFIVVLLQHNHNIITKFRNKEFIYEI